MAVEHNKQVNQAHRKGTNFRKLLDYGGMPLVKHRYDDPLTCSGFCTACESAGFLRDAEPGLRLDQMSHSADTSDFEDLLGILPTPTMDDPVLFLLESPGGYYKLGEPLTFQGVTKQPPVHHYYWTPRETAWSRTSQDLSSLYGPYFAYLVYKFRLKHAYFTNIVKCSLGYPESETFIPYYVVKDESVRDSRIRKKCYELFLSEELKIIQPSTVFYFG